jgi:hypothetical protein
VKVLRLPVIDEIKAVDALPWLSEYRDMEAASSSAVLLEDAVCMHNYICQHLTLTD